MQQNILSLEEVKLHFDHWRSTRTKRSKIPPDLWSLVKQIMNRYSLSIIAKTLGINTKQIRSSIDIDAKTNFVEVNTDGLMSSSSSLQSSSIDHTQTTCCIELHRAKGGMLKISALPLVFLTAMIAKFME